MRYWLLTLCLLSSPVFGQTYESMLADGALVARWNGDANADDTGDADDAVGVNDGVWTGTETYGTAPADKGAGKSFDHGVRANTIECPSELTTGGECSFTAWFKFAGGTSAVEFTVIADFDNAASSNDGFWLRYDSTSNQWEPHAYASNVGAVFNFADTSPDDGNWHHVACTMGASEIRLYIDATEIGTGQALSTLPAAKAAAVVGIGNCPISSTDDWQGETYDLRYYSKELTSAEITAIYNGPSSGPVIPVIIHHQRQMRQ